MNFLAHRLLACPGQGRIAGGVLGDFVKRKMPESLPPALRAGIRLHRRIDAFANRSADMKPSSARFDACIPDRSRPFIERMMETDLPARYAEPAVRDRALRYVSSRLRLTHLNAALAALLDARLAAFVEGFHGCFPKLQAFAAAERQRCLDGGLQLGTDLFA